MYKFENEQHKKHSESIRFLTRWIHSRLKEYHEISNKMLGECPDLIQFPWGETIKCYHLPYHPGDEYRDYAIVDIGREFDILWVFYEKTPENFHLLGYCDFDNMEEDYTGDIASNPIRKIPIDDLYEDWDRLIKYLNKQKKGYKWSCIMNGFE